MVKGLSLLYVTPSVSRDIGGIFEVERNLALQLHSKGIDVDVVGLIDPHTADDLPKWKPLVPTCYKVTGPAVVGYNRHFIKRLFASPANIGHIHSIWSYITFAMFAWSKKNKYPYLISPNGMLDEWAINNSKWKKKLALSLGIRKILKNWKIKKNKIQCLNSMIF
jgi:poly(glycerol-phosphate) alpha-glucosyltransferase